VQVTLFYLFYKSYDIGGFVQVIEPLCYLRNLVGTEKSGVDYVWSS